MYSEVEFFMSAKNKAHFYCSLFKIEHLLDLAKYGNTPGIKPVAPQWACYVAATYTCRSMQRDSPQLRFTKLAVSNKAHQSWLTKYSHGYFAFQWFPPWTLFSHNFFFFVFPVDFVTVGLNCSMAVILSIMSLSGTALFSRSVNVELFYNPSLYEFREEPVQN